MAGPLLVGAEGVLLIEDKGSYAASRPITEGIELAMQLFHFPTSRMVVLTGLVDTDGAQHFCRIHGLAKAAVVGINPEDKIEDPWTAQWYSIERERAAGPINMVLTSYPEVFERCMESHQPVLLFGRRGSVGTLDTRPSWGQLHERVIARRDAIAEEIPDEEIDPDAW
jgi:hypothetical protein